MFSGIVAIPDGPGCASTSGEKLLEVPGEFSSCRGSTLVNGDRSESVLGADASVDSKNSSSLDELGIRKQPDSKSRRFFGTQPPKRPSQEAYRNRNFGMLNI